MDDSASDPTQTGKIVEIGQKNLEVTKALPGYYSRRNCISVIRFGCISLLLFSVIFVWIMLVCLQCKFSVTGTTVTVPVKIIFLKILFLSGRFLRFD